MARIPLHRRLLYTGITLLLLAGVAEGISRAVWSVEDVAVNPALAYLADHPTLFWTLRPNLSGYVTLDGFTLTSNELGMREAPITDPAPFLRILSMGESTTWGHGVEAEQTYSELLETRLRADGADAEVINAGIGAWTIWQSYVFLMEHGEELAPDKVLIYHLHNDWLPRGVKDANNFLYEVRYTDRQLYELRYPYRHLLALLYDSRLYLALRKRLLALPSDLPEELDEMTATSGDMVRVPMADRQVALQGIREICDRIGAELVVLMPVYRRHPGRDHVLSDFAHSSRSTFINLPQLKQEAGLSDEDFFLDAVHPSVSGHAWIAAQIHAALTGGF